MPTPEARAQREHRSSADSIAVILAVGLSLAINLITFAVVYDAIFNKGPQLSENATQILTTAFGGIIGLLGGFVGYAFGKGLNKNGANGGDTYTFAQPIPPPTPPPPRPPIRPPKPEQSTAITAEWPARTEIREES